MTGEDKAPLTNGHMDDERIALMALKMIRGVGDVSVRGLQQHFGSAGEALRATAPELAEVGGLGRETAERIVVEREAALRRAEQELRFATDHAIRIYTPADSDYPARLRACPDAPSVVYYRGTVDLNMARIVSIVGTRRCTDYGTDLTARLVEGLAAIDPSIVIVSGLAYGIDVCAHRSALRMGLPTVGVLAHGLDRIYPAAHRATAAEMTSCGGLLTDFPSGTNPVRENFLRRNRLIAALADATVIIESPVRSGALSTAAYAHAYTRQVFACPGRVTDEQSAGCLHLIFRQRARLITSAEDLCQAMAWTPSEIRPKATRSASIPSTSSRPSATTPLPDNAVTRVLRSEGPTQINDLARLADLSVREVMPLLFDLEMDGLVTTLPGGMYKLI